MTLASAPSGSIKLIHHPAEGGMRIVVENAICESPALKNCRIRASLEHEQRFQVDRPFLLPPLRDYLHGLPGSAAETTPRRLSVPYVQHSGPRMGRAL
jgi:hypothetical protein